MHMVLGPTGNTGKALVDELLERRQPVTAVVHEGKKAEDLSRKGAKVAVAEVRDVEKLRAIFKTGEKWFLLNPPASVTTDTKAAELETVHSILSAVEGSGLKKVVAQSTYGAQPGERIGDLSVLYEMEQGLGRQSVPIVVMRAAYFMSNWAATLQSVRDESKVVSFFPADFELPMVAAVDLAGFAADRLMEPQDHTGTFYVEGPERYTPADVARAFTRAMKKNVEVQTVPREDWFSTYVSLGFSQEAAKSYERMTAAAMKSDPPPKGEAFRGNVHLDDYIAGLVAASA